MIRRDYEINRYDRVVVHYSDGDYVYEFLEVKWGGCEEEPVLRGKRMLKSGKPSKRDWDDTICAFSYLHNVEKQSPKAIP